ncbi:MAG TPA: 4Fe-4S ferredoxin [Candidatus Margulisiibacteriota bacterium]|nr:4Fe-4S ferredoxin [Candidatus Margulisiibacteriota bacterium]
MTSAAMDDVGSASDVRSPEPRTARRVTKSADGKFIGQRKVKPKQLAVITDACSGCSGAPVCEIYCPVDECMLLVPAADGAPHMRIWVDPLKCVGCRKCVSRGPEDLFLDGCPWDAIRMVPTPEWEAEHGELPY